MIILDTETTGLDNIDEICEIAMIDGNGKVLLNTLVKPTIPIPKDAIDIHGITNEMVADAPSWTELHEQFKALTNGKDIYIYNAEFDVDMLNWTMRTHDLDFDWNNVTTICVMHEYAEYAGEWNDYFEDWKWHSLTDAAHACGVPVKNAHRALGDCRMILGILKYMDKNSRKPEAGGVEDVAYKKSGNSNPGFWTVMVVLALVIWLLYKLTT